MNNHQNTVFHQIENTKFPRVFKYINDDLYQIIDNIDKIQDNDACHHWQVGTLVNNKTTTWKKLSLSYCKDSLNIEQFNIIKRDLRINMNNHQNAIFHQIENLLKTPLALLGVYLKNFQFNKICHFVNPPYLCRGL